MSTTDRGRQRDRGRRQRNTGCLQQTEGDRDIEGETEEYRLSTTDRGRQRDRGGRQRNTGCLQQTEGDREIEGGDRGIQVVYNRQRETER